MSIYSFIKRALTAGKSRDTRSILYNLLAITLLAGTAAWCDTISTVSSPSGLGQNDSINWATQLGSDQTILGQSFSVHTASGRSVNVGLTGPNAEASVVCVATSCSWTGSGFTAGDTVLWTSDAANGGTGPVTLSFGSSPVTGAGAYIQSDAPGGFTAIATAYNSSNTALGSASIVSGSGNAVYVGLLDQTGPNVASVVFSISCTNGCNPADFAIDTVGLLYSGPGVGLNPPSSSSSPINFGNQTVNTTSSPIPVTVTNTGTGTLSISNISESGAGFAQTNNCSSVTAGATCTINITFTPTSATTFNGTISITDNATGSPQAIYVTGTGVTSLPSGLQFVPITPCRIVDTRNTGGQISGGTSRAFTIGGVCGIPSNAAAYSLNFTVVPPGPLTYITVWPVGQPQPTVSTLNSFDGRVKANAAIVPAGTGGQIDVYASDPTNVIIDTNGYFITAGTTGALAFYPLTPCRIVDTRSGSGFGGQFGAPSLTGGSTRTFPINPKSGTSDACSSTIPSNAQAYSLNFSVIPPNNSPVGYITVWPTGGAQPVVSTLNDPTGTIVANAAIVPGTGTNGSVNVYTSDTTDLLIDIDGYFAAPGGSGALSLYTVTPCRELDTRNTGGYFQGQLPVNISASGNACGIPSTAQAYVLNATVIPQSSLLYLSLYPYGESQPIVSTLNALDGAVTSNMAIVPGSGGLIDAYAYSYTQLLLDISSYFAP